MRIGILSRNPALYSTRRLAQAVWARGHQAQIIDTTSVAVHLGAADAPPGATHLLTGGAIGLAATTPLPVLDAIIPRIGTSVTFYGLAVVRQFEQMDVYTPNTANGISNSRDKLRAIQILSRHNIDMPATAFVRNRADVRPAIESVGGAPVVIKLLEGTQGIGVILAPQIKVAEAIIETLHSTRQNVLIQRFVSESRGKDIRALVVGDRVVAATTTRPLTTRCTPLCVSIPCSWSVPHLRHIGHASRSERAHENNIQEESQFNSLSCSGT